MYLPSEGFVGEWPRGECYQASVCCNSDFLKKIHKKIRVLLFWLTFFFFNEKLKV